jgi:hypothetical protein
MYAMGNNVDVKAPSPWPRLRVRPRRITYRQVFARCWAVLGVAYALLALMLVLEPWRQMEPADKLLIPTLLVVMAVLGVLAAGLTALMLSTVWWFCWAS